MTTPDRVFMAERKAAGGWRDHSMPSRSTVERRIASALLRAACPRNSRSSSSPRNSIDHALLAFGALVCRHSLLPGIPGLFAGVAAITASSAMPDEAADARPRLRRRRRQVRGSHWPMNVSPADRDRGIAGARCPAATSPCSPDLHGDAAAHPSLDATHDSDRSATRSQSSCCTSGSTGNPKAVINTQRMICANQGDAARRWPFLKDEPPVIVDWLPWNHTFGGNHNIGLTLYNGGSTASDEGKPMPGGIEETVRNLRDFADGLFQRAQGLRSRCCRYLRDDTPARRSSSAGCTRCSFPAPRCRPFVWNSLDELAVQETGATGCRC